MLVVTPLAICAAFFVRERILMSMTAEKKSAKAAGRGTTTDMRLPDSSKSVVEMLANELLGMIPLSPNLRKTMLSGDT
jgi:hypothetical protein